MISHETINKWVIDGVLAMIQMPEGHPKRFAPDLLIDSDKHDETILETNGIRRGMVVKIMPLRTYGYFVVR